MDPLLAASVAVIITVFVLLRRHHVSKLEDVGETLHNEVKAKTMREMRRRAIEQAKKDGKNYYDLLFDDICPLCGERLETKIYGSDYQFSDHECHKCGFITKGEVLV